MRVNLKIQWGYTFFLTWRCKTNYFKYKLCLVYNYMERTFLCYCDPWEIPLNVLLCSFFFFLFSFPPSALMAEEVTASSGPWRSLHATFSAAPQSDPVSFIVLACFLLPLFYLAKWCGDGVSVRFNIPSDLWKTLSKPWKETRRTSARQAAQACPVWLHICREPKPFLLIWRACCQKMFSSALNTFVRHRRETHLQEETCDSECHVGFEFAMLWFCF